MTAPGYGDGGQMQPGWTVATNTSGEPEPILAPEQWRRLAEEE
ncbi:hypothetical protein OG713_34925 [Streptomyces sp. NBC_00723]